MKELQEVIIPDQFVFIRDKPPSTIARADTPCLIELMFGANRDMRGLWKTITTLMRSSLVMNDPEVPWRRQAQTGELGAPAGSPYQRLLIGVCLHPRGFFDKGNGMLNSIVLYGIYSQNFVL